MGLMNTLLGNVSEMSLDALQKDFGPVLCDGERIEKATTILRREEGVRLSAPLPAGNPALPIVVGKGDV